MVGLWYGKAPGVDRSGDALKHENFAGTSRHGAVVVLSGDDHEAKSSTMPYQDDYAFVGHGMPVVYPASWQWRGYTLNVVVPRRQVHRWAHQRSDYVGDSERGRGFD